ncbi:MAG TPA: helix-turn-helix domain-containing protein [Rhizomicrobium sp.]|jgi:AcrR family transcriptional regulator
MILEAAEGTITRTGPAGLRLQDVAKAAGVSHPTILHHFGSREGLVKALNLRTLEDLKAALVAGMKTDDDGDDGITRTFAAYRGGLAERMVWLMQSEAAPPPGGMTIFEGIVAALHEVRQSFARPGHPPDIADTRAVVHLTTIAALGDALMGARLRQTSGAQERAQGAAFEKWFGALITQFLRAKV